MALTADVKKEAEAIMASADVANMKVQKLNDLWLQHGLASHQQHTPDRFLIHPMNRGGAMINGHDMVAKGERLLAQGLRKDLLECSAVVAFAMSSSASERDSQVLANKTLSEQFNTIMQPPTGKELFLTVGCSHTTMFLKNLGKIDGLTNTNYSLQAGHPLHDCIQHGWQWLILSDVLERELPGLPLLYSSVLNNTNAVHVASTEMECLATLSKFFKMNRSLEEAINATKQREPVCKSYLNSIAHFAQRYCGGTEMPMVDFLVAFSALSSVILNMSVKCMA